MPAPRRSCSRIALAALLVLLLAPAALRAQDAQSAARELAQKILAGAGPQPSVALSMRNLSSLPVASAGQVRQALEEALRNAGARLLTATPADVEVRVTLSENLQGYLWVAEIHRGDVLQVAMVSLPRSAVATEAQPASALALAKKQVWQQAQPILDWSNLPGGANRLAVLDPEGVLVVLEDTRGPQRATMLAQALPRDPRGRLRVSGDSLQVELGSEACAGPMNNPRSYNCQSTDAAWPLVAGAQLFGSARLSPGKNFFDGEVQVGSGAKKSLPPFFSFAAVEEQGSALWVFAGLDGRAHLYDKALAPVGVIDGWGSDIVGARTNCGSGWQVLTTRAGDWTQPDAIEAFEIADRQAVPASDPLSFDGPVTALWPGSDAGTVNAVVHNLKTGQYEAYSVSISCSH
jgi:hypothetical protein